MLWWNLVEAGLGLLASCLPTLWFLFRKATLRSVIKSLRSLLPSVSLHSQSAPNSSFRTDNYSEIHHLPSGNSAVPIYGTESKHEAYVTSDGKNKQTPDEPDQIHIEHGITQVDDMV